MISETLVRVIGVPGGGIVITTMGPAGRTALELDAETAARFLLSVVSAMTEPAETAVAAGWIERCRHPRPEGPGREPA